MKNRRKLGLAGLLVGLVGLLLVGTSGSVAANNVVPTNATLTLDVAGNGGSWTLSSDPANPQTLGKSGACGLIESGPSLVTITGVSDDPDAFAGIFKGAIGTKDINDGNGEPCARIDSPDQALVLGLGSAVTSTYEASGADIALKFKFNATATIKAYLGGTSGTLVHTKIVPCDGGSDCGPDSGLSDVAVIPIELLLATDRFDTLEIVSTGAVSLVSSATAETHIHLATVPRSAVSGKVFVDANANDQFDAGPPPEAAEKLTVTVYEGTTEVAQQQSTGGTYSFSLREGRSYTLCLEQRSTHEQTVPDLEPEGSGVDCSGLGPHEKVGYGITTLASDVSGKDFGNLELLVCDDPQTTSGTAISGTFEIFTNSNLPCGDKGNFLSVELIDDPDNPGTQVEVIVFLLDGNGEAAARGEITKSDAGPVFVPLTYSPAEDGDFVVLPWCNVRDKIAGDGDQFDADLGNDGLGGVVDRYPNLFLVEDSPGVDSISCKVTQFEDILGNQVTVVFGEFLDPFYR